MQTTALKREMKIFWKLVILGIVAIACMFLLQLALSFKKNPAFRDVIHGDLPVVKAGPWAKNNKFSSSLSTDKPLYRPGETVQFKAVVLNVFDRTPFSFKEVSRKADYARYLLKDASGEIKLRGEVKDFENGVAYASISLPADFAGGEYTLVLQFPQEQRIPLAERKIQIRAFRNPKLNGSIKLDKKAYGKKEMVTAVLSVQRAEGGIPRDAVVEVQVMFPYSYHQMQIQPVKLDSEGAATIQFEIPGDVVESGALNCIVHDGGIMETISTTIPLVTEHVLVTFYTASRNLLAGHQNLVYFEAKDASGAAPIDIKGVIVDTLNEEVVAQVTTEHEGRGKFNFSPKDGRSYVLKVTSPVGINSNIPLPNLGKDAASIIPKKDVFPSNEPVEIQVAVPNSVKFYTVKLYKRERLLQEAKLTAAGTVRFEESHVRSDGLAIPVDGVLVVTVFDDETQIPIAERLVFKEPAKLAIDIETDREKYSPGDEVSLTLTARDGQGKPVASIAGVSVLDESVIQMVEARQRPPTLPVMVHLEGDVKSIEDAQIFMSDSANPAVSQRAVDLLLGCQSWGRVFNGYQYYADVLYGLKELGVQKGPIRRNAVREVAAKVFEDNIKHFAFSESVDDMQVPADSARVTYTAAKIDIPITERKYFEDSVLWKPAMHLDEKGKTTIKFTLSDSITSFRIAVDAFSTHGLVGYSETKVTSSKLFYVEAKLPLSTLIGDKLQIPISLINNVDIPLHVHTKGSLSLTDTLSIPLKDHTVLIQPLERVTHYAELTITPDLEKFKAVMFNIQARATYQTTNYTGSLTDGVSRPLQLSIRGFPQTISKGGRMAAGVYKGSIELPSDYFPASLQSSIKVYTSPASNLLEAVKALLRSPHGCFEQTSATVYPLVMAQQYFKSHSGVPESLIEQADQLIQQGYNRLVSFETKSHGYEWFGHEPAHEALTAYGLMEFIDMAKVYSGVSTDMLERTKNWLLSRRDGKRFTLNPRNLDSFGGAPAHITEAYIVWALIQAGVKDGLEQQIQHLLSETTTYWDDPYYLGLVAGILFNTGNQDDGKRIAARISTFQHSDGSVQRAPTSITGSYGESLVVETTSIAILTWLSFPLNDNPFIVHVEKAARWLATTCADGKFGGTQGTILALKAIIEYDALQSKSRPTKGTLHILVDGNLTKVMDFDQTGNVDAIVVSDALSNLNPGTHEVIVEMVSSDVDTASIALPCSLQVTFNTPQPPSCTNCKVRIQTKLANENEPIQQGHGTTIHVVVENLENTTQGMTLASIGVPAGLEVRLDKLKELVAQQKLAYYELFDNNSLVVLYWRNIKSNEIITISIDAIAQIPGSYQGKASSAYLYYGDEFKSWTAGLEAQITPASHAAKSTNNSLLQ